LYADYCYKYKPISGMFMYMHLYMYVYEYALIYVCI
jgi:hypothetical protein